MDLPLTRTRLSAEQRAVSLALALPAVTAATLVIAFVLRARRAFLLVDYPLNDGGMFYSLIEDLRATHYALPQTMSYNVANIPYAYPPLAFYLAALLHDTIGLSTVDAVRLLPPVLCTLVVAAFVPLARALSRDRVAAAVAIFVVATQPSAFTWLVMGGGLTRALGLFFATLALVALLRFYRTGSRAALVTGGVLGGLTLLSHVEMAWFMTFSAALFLFFYARDRRAAVIGSAAAAAVAAVIAAPWWVTILVEHGPVTLLYAASTGALSNPVVDLLIFRRTDEPYFPLIAAVGILGLVVCVFQRRWAFPAWLVATALLDQRSFNALSAFPLGLLAGVATTEFLAPLARDRRVLAAAAAAAVIYATFGAAKADQEIHRAISADERAAMTWVRDNTPPTATLIIVSQRFWAGDRVAEWLPALSQRHVVDTVQGTEWLPRERGFWQTLQGYDDAQECGDEGGGCLLGWANAYTAFDYVYLPKTLNGYTSEGTAHVCCAALRLALRSDSAFALVYDGPGATIFKRSGG